MKITAIEIENIKSFHYVPKTELSKRINILIGQNNTGKTTILKSIFLLQNDCLNIKDITKGYSNGNISLHFEGEHLGIIVKKRNGANVEKCILRLALTHTARVLKPVEKNQNEIGFQQILENEPHNLIYPYLSKRKLNSYTAPLNEINSNAIKETAENLFLKIDRLVSGVPSKAEKFKKACNDVLGFEVRSETENGAKIAVYYIDDDTYIPVTSMGEGIINMLGLIVHLCYSKDDKIFLIEEIENDMHPKALKALLKLIVEKSTNNQFFISTHSNIVMKYLGAEPDTKIFNITNDLKDDKRGNLFLSQMKEVANDPEERRKVLEDLGYEFYDFDLWENWLFLEESSAEIIIRDYLITWFVSDLSNKIRTFSTNGKANVNPKFDDFNRLFVFLHLQPTYKNKTWVLIDGGDEEAKIIQNMRETYSKSGWSESNFSQLEKHDFELYYPNLFQDKVALILALNGDDKRKAKKDLINEVKDWIKDNEELAKSEFEKSAAEVIEKLKSIEKQIAL